MITKHYCYKVRIGNCVMAQYMELDTATTLAKALFEQHSDEEAMDITIQRVRINEVNDPGCFEEPSNGCWNCKYKNNKLTDEPCLNCGPYNGCWEADCDTKTHSTDVE